MVDIEGYFILFSKLTMNYRSIQTESAVLFVHVFPKDSIQKTELRPGAASKQSFIKE